MATKKKLPTASDLSETYEAAKLRLAIARADYAELQLQDLQTKNRTQAIHIEQMEAVILSDSERIVELERLCDVDWGELQFAMRTALDVVNEAIDRELDADVDWQEDENKVAEILRLTDIGYRLRSGIGIVEICDPEPEEDPDDELENDDLEADDGEGDTEQLAAKRRIVFGVDRAPSAIDEAVATAKFAAHVRRDPNPPAGTA